VNDQPLEDERNYKVATNSFLAEGGDLYSTFLAAKQSDSGGALSDVVIDHFRSHPGAIAPPERGRWVASGKDP
jgi:2',3'-cyclic-nucleotide 2'-phosphodiesterase (5'-nucleotidase family)